jgi:tRNA1(Val) A37 N6-methylase TrmN6
MLLAHFVNVSSKTKKIIDLGCGNAPIPLYLSLKTQAKIIGVDIQSEICDMAKRSVDLNNLSDQIDIINADIKDIYKVVGTNCFDIVTSNPPYFKYKESSNVNKNDYLTIARHEVKIDLEGIISESKKLLNEGGCLYMVHRVERFGEIIKCLDKYNFKIKRLKFMYPKVNSSEALLVILEAKNNAREGMKVLPPIFMYNEDGTYTDDALEIFNFKKQN